MNHEQLQVEKLVNGGYGLARLQDGRVVLLRNALPGELVRFRSEGRLRQTFFGSVQTVVAPHRQRIAPPCRYYGECGGCDLQHCSYDCQLELKKDILAELCHRQEAAVADPVPSPRRFGYRQRIRLQTAAGKVGYLRFRSATVVPIDECLIAHPAINRALATLLADSCFARLCRHSQEVELHHNPGTGAVDLLFTFNRVPRPADRKAAVSLSAAAGGVDRVFFKGRGFALDGPHGTDDSTAEQGRTLHCPPIHPLTTAISSMCWEIDGFSQVNQDQNRNLVDLVVRRVALAGGEDILDLFCGMGNFSIPLAAAAASLVGVEGQGSGIRCARRNAAAAGLTNTTFIKGPAGEICGWLLAERRSFDITVLDPPRQGIPDLVPGVAALTRRMIVYISCDPATLARDLKDLGDHGFRCFSLEPLDMFPQTHHIETVALLEKR